MPRPQLSNDELAAYYDNGEIYVFAYRDLYQIKWSHGVTGYVMAPLHKNRSPSLPYTKRGRFVVRNEEGRNSLTNGLGV